MPNQSPAAPSEAVNLATCVQLFEGEALGLAEGLLLGEVEGDAKGEMVGLVIGLAEGLLLGEAGGDLEGLEDGDLVGDMLVGSRAPVQTPAAVQASFQYVPTSGW